MPRKEQSSEEIHKGNIVYISICIIILIVLRILLIQTPDAGIENLMPELLQTIWSEVDMYQSAIEFFGGIITNNLEAAGTLLVTSFQYIYISRFIKRAVKVDFAVDKLLHFLADAYCRWYLPFSGRSIR